MKNFSPIIFGVWCLLISTTAIAQSTSSFLFPITNYYFLAPSVLSNTTTVWAPFGTCTDRPDDDNDGICNDMDCAPTNPAIPAAPGTSCNDNNDFTKDDKVQSDGCTCLGTTLLKDTPITIDLGADREFTLGETVTIKTSVLQFNTCIVTTCKEETPLIAHWDMNHYQSKATETGTVDYSATVKTSEEKTFCANLVTKGLYRNEGAALVSTTSFSKKAKKAVVADMPLISDFENNHPQSLRFDIVVDPTADVSRITKLTFMEKTPSKATTGTTTRSNNTPTKYGIRILKGGKEIYKAIDMMTNKKWTEALFDFSNEPIFEVSSTSVFTIELLAYGQNKENTATSMWNLDDIKIYGGCCNTTSFQSSRYTWSTGERTNSIDAKAPGTYIVTVTDCNGTTAVDEVVVKQK